jgi:MOSC domain-containing protein YiiM
MGNSSVNTGSIAGIFIASEARGPMLAVEGAHAIAGRGLEGDHYFNKQGTFWKEHPDFQLTLIEEEAIAALARDYGIKLEAGKARRNLITRGVALNHLVGREFRIGSVRIRGIRLCEPCSHLESVSGLPVIKGLRHRGGLRAEILEGGEIRVGDAIELAPPVATN